MLVLLQLLRRTTRLKVTDAALFKIAELMALKSMLGHLVEHCHGDHRPDCPIMDELGGQSVQ